MAFAPLKTLFPASPQLLRGATARQKLSPPPATRRASHAPRPARTAPEIDMSGRGLEPSTEASIP